MAARTHTAFTTCPLCEASCGLRIETDAARRHVLRIDPDEDDILSHGYLCTKARALSEIHEDPDRLRQPMRRTANGTFEPVSWQQALDETIRRLCEVRAAHGPDALGIYLGNPTVHNHEAMFGAAELVGALRTRNRYSASSADQNPHMFVAMQMLGHQLLIPVPDIDRTDLFVVIGGNPAASNGSLMTAPGIVRRIKALQARGGRLIVLDPRRTETAALADAHHFIHPGTDALALLAVLHVLFAEGLVRPGRLAPYLHGLSDVEHLVAPWTPERVAPATGVPADTLRELARTIAAARTACVYGRVGVCTQAFGGVAAWLIQLVNILTGNLDRPGGMMLTRPAFDSVAFASLLRHKGSFGAWHSRDERRLPEFNRELPVAALADEILLSGPGQLRALITFAGNPVLSAPNGARLERALERLDFMVAVDLYLNETSRHAHLVLPPVSPLERPSFHFALAMFSVRHTVKYCPPVLVPPADVPSDAHILSTIARGLMASDGLGRRLAAAMFGLVDRFGGTRRMVDLGLRLGPYGARSRLRRVRPLPHRVPLSLAEVERHPHGIDLGPLEAVLPERLETPERRIRLAPSALCKDLGRLARAMRRGELGAGRGGLVLIGRRHMRSNNSWMHNTPHLAPRERDCTLLIHPEDAAARGVADGARVVIRSRTGAVETTARVTDDVMRGVVSLPHGHGHARARQGLRVASRVPGVSINDLTDERHVDELTGNAGFSGVAVEVVPLDPTLHVPFPECAHAPES